MTNWCDDTGSVRMTLFKPSGKWYADYAIPMHAFYNVPMCKDAVYDAYKVSHPNGIEKGWMLVCLDPYHEHSHPQLIVG
jgi:hypothetical protein